MQSWKLRMRERIFPTKTSLKILEGQTITYPILIWSERAKAPTSDTQCDVIRACAHGNQGSLLGRQTLEDRRLKEHAADSGRKTMKGDIGFLVKTMPIFSHFLSPNFQGF